MTTDQMQLVQLKRDGRDPMIVASEYAKSHGLKICTTMRWRGASGPEFRDVEAVGPEGERVEIRIID